MSTATLIKVTAAIYGLALLLSSLAAHAQEMNHLPTIADCPPGYTLGVQQTDEPMPMAAAPYQSGGNQQQSYLEQQADAQRKTLAQPRQFITGCIPPQQQQR